MTHQWNNDETIAKTTVIYDNAHNEYLQYFVTIGPIGVLSYVGILICACIEMNRRKEKSPYVLGCFFAVLCYAVQATVNLCVPIVAPIMWMLMSVGTAQSEDEE
jgi:O-antigen ligase